VTLTQFLSEHFAIMGGLLNTLDGDMTPFSGSTRGRGQFLNTGFVLSPVTLFNVPYSALGGGIIWLPTESVTVSSVLMNYSDTTGQSPFSETSGETFATEAYLSHELFDRPSGHMFGVVLTRDDFLTLGQRLTLPPDQGLERDDFTWAAYYNFYHYLQTFDEEPGNWTPLAPNDGPAGWGLFGRLGVSDGDPNPIEWFASAGVGGDVPFRQQDRWGVGFYYQGMTDANLASRLRLDDEVGFEAWYNFEVTPWFHLTPDLQVIDQGLPGTDTAVLFGLRGNITF
jgi:porin